jgi:hypothetical protein
LEVLMVIGGGEEYCWLFALAVGLAGQPAATAALFAAAWAAASAAVDAEVVVVLGATVVGAAPLALVDVAGALVLASFAFFGPLDEEASAYAPIATPARTTTVMARRVMVRRFFARSSSASRAWRAARFLARFSVGTARHTSRYAAPAGIAASAGSPVPAGIAASAGSPVRAGIAVPPGIAALLGRCYLCKTGGQAS